MTIHISELYGLDIYNDDAKYVGKVNDIILNLETGKVVRLTTEPLRSISKEKAKEVLRDRSVLYKNVVAVGDIVVVGKGKNILPEEEEIDAQKRGYRKVGATTSFKRPQRSLLGRTN